MNLSDNWSEKTSEMLCKTCMFYVNFRCRRSAPTIKGFPAVYPEDWCGEHKLDKKIMMEIRADRMASLKPKEPHETK